MFQIILHLFLPSFSSVSLKMRNACSAWFLHKDPWLLVFADFRVQASIAQHWSFAGATVRMLQFWWSPCPMSKREGNPAISFPSRSVHVIYSSLRWSMCLAYMYQQTGQTWNNLARNFLRRRKPCLQRSSTNSLWRNAPKTWKRQKVFSPNQLFFPIWK